MNCLQANRIHVSRADLYRWLLALIGGIALVLYASKRCRREPFSRRKPALFLDQLQRHTGEPISAIRYSALTANKKEAPTNLDGSPS